MKQKIYLPGIISLDLLIVGVLFKMMHWPGAGILMTTGFVILTVIFFPLALRDAYRARMDRKTLPLYVVSYITLLILFTGMLFKIQHWPGAGILLTICLPLPFVLFLPVFLAVTKRLENFSILKIVGVLLVLTIMSAFDALLALNVTKEKLDDSMFLASLYHRTAQLREASHMEHTQGSNAVLVAADMSLELIGRSVDQIIEAGYPDGGSFAEDPYSFMYADDKNLVMQVLYNPTEQENPLAFQLEQSLSSLVNAIGSAGNPVITKDKAMYLLYFNPEQVDDRSWNRSMFEGVYSGWALVYLETLRNNIMLITDEFMMQQDENKTVQ